MEIISYILLAAFIGLVVWQIIKGVPTRKFHIKHGLNTIVKIFAMLYVLLGLALLITLTPGIVGYVLDNVSDTFSMYLIILGWLVACLIIPMLTFSPVGSLEVFKYTSKELEYIQAKKAEEDKAYKVLFNKIKNVFKKHK